MNYNQGNKSRMLIDPISSSPQGVMSLDPPSSPRGCYSLLWNPNSNKRTRGASCGGSSSNSSSRQKSPQDVSVVKDAFAFEKELAKELLQLSVSERALISDDIHGVRLRNDDNVKMLSKAQVEHLLQEIASLPPKQRAAWDQAAFVAPSYVRNVTFLSKFYRFQYYSTSRYVDRPQGTTTDPPVSDRPFWAAIAKQIAGHFRVKEAMFGRDALGRDIQQDLDFSPSERQFLCGGGCQRLAVKDSTGRMVLFVSPMLYDWQHPQPMFKKLWYTYMSFAEDPAAQDKGVVVVFYFMGHQRMPPAKFGSVFCQGGPDVLDHMPVRPSAFHACYDQPWLLPVLYTVPKLLEASSRLRFRAHYGSPMECQYALQSFGIPVHVFPLEDDGSSLKTSWYRQYLTRRRQSEHHNHHHDESSSLPCTFSAGPNDVLLGRGRRIQEHAGNLWLGQMVKERYEDYQDPDQKQGICLQLVHQVAARGGRFLKLQDGDWEQVSEVDALAKVAVVFRTHKKLLKRKQEKQESSSSSKGNKEENTRRFPWMHVTTTTTTTTTTVTTTTTTTVGQPSMEPQAFAVPAKKSKNNPEDKVDLVPSSNPLLLWSSSSSLLDHNPSGSLEKDDFLMTGQDIANIFNDP